MGWGYHAKYVCIPCRDVRPFSVESCIYCKGPVITQSWRWRAPRKTNDKAWKRIEAGDWLWEKPKAKASDRSVHWDGATKSWKSW